VPNLTAGIGNLTHALLNLVFPIRCVGCQSQGKLFCERCARDLPVLQPPFCLLCAQPDQEGYCRGCAPVSSQVSAIDGIRAPFLMEGAIRKAIHEFKYRSVFAIAPELGALLANYFESNPIPADTIAPVPLHPRRLRSRGYNQAALLATQLGKLSDIQVEEHMLARTKDTPPQAQSISQQRRQINVSESFTCVGDASGKAILLVDDVVTTGSTMSACAAALKQHGATSVWGLALARES